MTAVLSGLVLLATRVSQREAAPAAPAGDDRRLCEAAAGGDRNAFEELYRRHADAVYRRMTRLVGPVAEREDLVQHVFFDAYRALPGFRGEAAFSTFLYRIVVNVAYDHLRKRKHLTLGDEELATLVAPGLSPEAAAREREQMARALRCLAALKPQKRIAYVLRVVEGLSLDEIGVLVGANAPAVGQRVKHAQRELEAMVDRLARRETI